MANEAMELIQIRNGAEYPIICDKGKHYYYEDLHSHKRMDKPFEICNSSCPNWQKISESKLKEAWELRQQCTYTMREISDKLHVNREQLIEELNKWVVGRKKNG